MKPLSVDGPHQLDVAIGRRIRERRRALGVSQQALASALGVSFQQVQKYELGSNRVSFSRLAEIAQALKCRVGDLAEGLEAERTGEIGRINALMETDGAMALLEAYAALKTPALRRVLLQHARALRSALEETDAVA